MVKRTERTDPMFYNIEIEEVATGKRATSEVACYWSGDQSATGYRQMCDCQLAGWFHAKPHVAKNLDGSETKYWSGAYDAAQYGYLKANHCAHEPSAKFAARRAVLASGDVIELQ